MTAKEQNIRQFEIFIQNDYENLLNYAKSRLNNYFDAEPEDIIQDVAINIFNKLDINAPIENLAGYFYRALRNRIYDLFKKGKKEYSIENYNNERGENTLLNSIGEENEVEIKKEREKQYELIFQAIENLNEEEQLLIIETEFNKKTFQELSEMLNVPVGTLLSKKHRALGKINKMLENK